MTRTLISSGSPFEKQVGYSRAVVQGDWCFVAGTTCPDPATWQFPYSVQDQTANALAIIGKALADGGFSFADVVKATYYITDPSYWDLIGPVLGGVFGEVRPAATCVVAGLIRSRSQVSAFDNASPRKGVTRNRWRNLRDAAIARNTLVHPSVSCLFHLGAFFHRAF